MPPKNEKKSGLMAKYADKAAELVEKHAEDKTTSGYIRLPGGINNGIALLTECYFAEYENGTYKGEYYFRAVGEVMEPTEVKTPNGTMQVRGLQTTLMIPFCDTKTQAGAVTTQDQYITTILNHMRLLGGDEYTKGARLEDLEDLAAGLVDVDNPIYFKFTTSQSPATEQYPDPRVWENWHGAKGLENYVPEEVQGVVVDDKAAKSPPPSQAKAQVATKAQAPAAVVKPGQVQAAKPGSGPAKSSPVSPPPATTKPAGPAAKGPAAKAPVKKAEAPPFVPETCDNLDVLLLDADSQSETSGDSQVRIESIGVDTGIDLQILRGCQTWGETVTLIKEHQANPQTEEGDGEWKPEVGGKIGYRPKDPKTKKPVDSPVECDIVAVSADGTTVDLKAGKATYKNIGLGDLEFMPE